MKNGNEETHDQLIEELNYRKRVDKVFNTVFPDEIGSDTLVVIPDDFDCLRDMYELYEYNCGHFDDYSLKYVKYFVNMCETAEWHERYMAASRMIEICSLQ